MKISKVKFDIVRGAVVDIPVAYIATDWRLNASRDEYGPLGPKVTAEDDPFADIVHALATRQIGWDTSYNVHVMPELPADLDAAIVLPEFEEVAKGRLEVLKELEAKAATTDAYNAEFRALKAMWCDKDGNVVVPSVWNNDCFRRLTSLRRANTLRFRHNLPLITSIPARVVVYGSELERQEANAAENTVGTSGRKDIGLSGLMALAWRMSCAGAKAVSFRPPKDKDTQMAQESIFGAKGQAFELICRIYKSVRSLEPVGTTPLLKRFTLPKDDTLHLDWKRFNNTNLGALVKSCSGMDWVTFDAELSKINEGDKETKTSALSAKKIAEIGEMDNPLIKRFVTGITEGDEGATKSLVNAYRVVGAVSDKAYAQGMLGRLNEVLLAIEPMLYNDKAYKALSEMLKTVKV